MSSYSRIARRQGTKAWVPKPRYLAQLPTAHGFAVVAYLPRLAQTGPVPKTLIVDGRFGRSARRQALA